MNYSPSGSSVNEIQRARMLEWVAIHFSGDLPNQEVASVSPTLQVDSLLLSFIAFVASLVAQKVKNLPAMWETGFDP